MKLTEFKEKNRIFLIAEVGQAHEGSFGILMSFIPCVARAGFDAIKFQVHIADAESSIYETFRIPYPVMGLSRKEYWRRMEFSELQWRQIKLVCEDHNIEFLATPFSVAAVQQLERMNVIRYKVGSGDTLNTLLLESIRATKKELIISGGLLSFDDFKQQINKLLQQNMQLAVMQCTTSYPTVPENTYLQDLRSMLDSFSVPVGFSDHSGTIYPGLAAAALGACMIEVHVTFDRLMFGPDSTSSLEVRELEQFVQGIRFIERARKSSRSLHPLLNANEYRKNFGRSLALNRDMGRGEQIKISDLESKKPAGRGISVEEVYGVIGKKLIKDLNKWDFLNESDLET